MHYKTTKTKNCGKNCQKMDAKTTPKKQYRDFPPCDTPAMPGVMGLVMQRI
jgi:hypothetical protein